MSIHDKLLKNIPYLEKEDVNQDGSLRVQNGKPSIVMVQGNFCGHCTSAKKIYAELPNEVQGTVNVYTVQADATDSSKDASSIISKVNNINGIPAFVGYDKNGKFKKMFNGNRDLPSLKKFATELY